MNKEKLYIAIIFILTILVFYFVSKTKKTVEIHFSKPVSPVGNFPPPARQDIWQVK